MIRCQILDVLIPHDGVSTGQRGVDGQVVAGPKASTSHTLMVLRRNVVILVEY